jgi:LPXTG-motif cell wall-anchored protein
MIGDMGATTWVLIIVVVTVAAVGVYFYRRSKK